MFDLLDFTVLQHIIQFTSVGKLKYGRVIAYHTGKKTIEKFNSPALKVVVVNFKRWSLRKGLDYSDLTGRNLVFWKSGRLEEVVALGGSTVFKKKALETVISQEFFRIY